MAGFKILTSFRGMELGLAWSTNFFTGKSLGDRVTTIGPIGTHNSQKHQQQHEPRTKFRWGVLY